MISERISRIEESPIRKIFDIAAKGKGYINLSIGVPDFDAPDDVKEKAFQSINAGFNRYTPSQGIAELRDKISEKLNRENKIRCSSDNIIVTSGSSGALFLAFSALLDHGDEIIMPDPYFVMYKQLASFLQIKPVFFDTYPDFKIAIDHLSSAITKKTKAIMVNSPNNPTGNVYSYNELKQIAKLAEENNITIISDEVYEKFIYGEEHCSIGRFYENTFTLNGFSKSHAITGWRLGYLCAPSEYIAPMVKLQQYSFVCAPSFAQKAVADSFDTDISAKVRDYKLKRDLIYNGIKDKFNVTKPDGAFYIFPEAPDGNGDKFVDSCVKKKLLVVPGSAFSQKNTHFRISFAAKDEELKKGIDILNRR